MGYNEDVMQSLSYSLRNFNDYSLPTLRRLNETLKDYNEVMRENNKLLKEANDLKKMELEAKGQYIKNLR